VGNQVKNHALPHTGIDHRCRSSETEKLTKFGAFTHWERVEAHLKFRNTPGHRASFLSGLDLNDWQNAKRQMRRMTRVGANQSVYRLSCLGGADRTMTKSILIEIDAQIALLKQAKALLSSAGTTAIKRKPGRPFKTVTIVVPVAQKAKKRKKVSAEGRERFRQA
jgi:hypothetical protein